VELSPSITCNNLWLKNIYDYDFNLWALQCNHDSSRLIHISSFNAKKNWHCNTRLKLCPIWHCGSGNGKKTNTKLKYFVNTNYIFFYMDPTQKLRSNLSLSEVIFICFSFSYAWRASPLFTWTVETVPTVLARLGPVQS
jgi:hypothetical protein